VGADGLLNRQTARVNLTAHAIFGVIRALNLKRGVLDIELRA